MKFRTKAATALASAAVIAGLAIPAANASTTPGTGLLVGPARAVLKVHGNRASESIEVINHGSTPAEVTMQRTLISETTDGAIVPVTSPEPASKSGLGWLTVKGPGRFLLQPGQRTRVRVRVIIPRGAVLTGNLDLALVFASTNRASLTAAKGTRLALHPSVASEMIVQLPGRVEHHPVWGLSLPGISFSRSMTVTTSLRASGNTYEIANGQHVQIGSKSVPVASLLALQGSTREATTTTSAPGYGPQTVVYHGIRRTVWVLPGQLLVILLGLVLLSGGCFWWLRSLRKHSRNRRHGPRRPAVSTN